MRKGVRMQTFNENRETYLTRLADQVVRLDERVNRLKRETGAQKNLARGQAEIIIDNILGKRKEMESKIKNARAAGQDAWVELKKGLDAGYSDLVKSINRAAEKFHS
jgi:hypothetical protein